MDTSDLIEQSICIRCKTSRSVPSGLFCWRCTAARAKARHAREAVLMGQPRMTWPQFVDLLMHYEFLAGLDFAWSYKMYETYGRHLAEEGVLGDIPELMAQFNERTFMGHPAEIRNVDDILESTQPQQGA